MKKNPSPRPLPHGTRSNPRIPVLVPLLAPATQTDLLLVADMSLALGVALGQPLQVQVALLGEGDGGEDHHQIVLF